MELTDEDRTRFHTHARDETIHVCMLAINTGHKIGFSIQYSYWTFIFNYQMHELKPAQ
jgi:hypothetical protein